jgi:hypothetical protein
LEKLQQQVVEILSTPSLGITSFARSLTVHVMRMLLSTPSLGITSAPSAPESIGSIFQLPLSGSLPIDISASTAIVPIEITFNSLSRDHAVTKVIGKIRLVSFNSLSRDHSISATRAGPVTVFWTTFNSLSRDHLADEVRPLPVDYIIVLSTPSLGITGSPRSSEAGGRSPRRLSTPSLGITGTIYCSARGAGR